MLSRRFSRWKPVCHSDSRCPSAGGAVRGIALLLLASLLLVTWVRPARADDGVKMSLAAYRTELLAAIRAVRQAQAESNLTLRKQLLGQAVQHLPPLVIIPDQAGSPFDQRTLDRQIAALQAKPDASPQTWQAAEDALQQAGLDAGLSPAELGARATSEPPPLASDLQRARARLQADMQRDVMHPPSWWERFWDKVGAGFRKLFSMFAVTRAAATPVQMTILALMACALLVGIVLLLRRVTISRRRKAATAPATEAEAWRTATAAEALSRADALAGREEYAQALRWLQRAALGYLDEAALLHFRPPTTDWEYLVEVASAPPQVRDSLRRLTERYQLAYFGGRPADAETYASGRQEYLRICQTVAAPKAPREAQQA